MLIFEHGHQGRDLNVVVVLGDRAQNLEVQPLAHCNNQFVVAVPCRVEGENLRGECVLLFAQVAAIRGVNIRHGDELLGRHRREHAANAHLHEVAVDAVIVHPFLNRGLVRDLYASAVDLLRVPAVAPGVEAVVKLTGVLRGVSEREEHRLTVGQAALGHFPNLIRDA